LASTIDDVLCSEQVRAKQREAFKDVSKALGDRTPPPSERAARVVLDIVGGAPAASARTLSAADPRP
jgi:hypothetical protein